MIFNYRTEYNRYRRYFTSLTPMAKTPVVRAYFSLIASLFALSFFGAFAIRPTAKTIIGLRKEIADARFTNAKLQEKINSLSEAQTQYGLVQTEIPTVMASLPKNSEFSTLLKQVENIAVASGSTISAIQFQSIVMFNDSAKGKQAPLPTTSPVNTKTSSSATPSAEQSQLGLLPIPFSIVLRGNYANISAFLTSLTHLSRLIEINSVTISSSAGGNVDLSLSIQTKAYYYE